MANTCSKSIFACHQKIPLSFYIPNSQLNVFAPNQLTIGITGKRIDLQKLNFANLGAHIDASNLNKAGKYSIHISQEDIFLPRTVKLLHYTPVMVNLELK